VQLHLKGLKGRNIWYKAQTVDNIQDMKLTEAIFFGTACEIINSSLISAEDLTKQYFLPLNITSPYVHY
jgi:hypothetical protein